jgi:hypothetical protein
MNKINEMNEKNEIKKTMKWLLGLSDEESKQVNQIIDEKGIKYLFLNLEKLDFEKEIIEKLNHLVTVIERIDGKIENVDFEEGKTNEK